MTPTPLLAEWRLVFDYTALLLAHKAYMFLDATPSGDASGYNAIVRGAFTPPGVSDLIDPFFDALKGFYKSSDAAFSGATLQHLVSGAWVPIYTAATTITPTGSGSGNMAMMVAYAGKTTDNKHIKYYIYEGSFGASSKTVGLGSLGVDGRKIVDYLFGTGTTPLNTDAWAWRMNKGKTYASRWLSQVVDSNEKLRRLRHIK